MISGTDFTAICPVGSISIICFIRLTFGISIREIRNLDVITDGTLSREQINGYFRDIEKKILDYISELDDEKLSEYPAGCEYSRFTLIMAQFRHLHTHMGMIMGFIIDDKGLWPRVLGLEMPFPEEGYSKYL